MVKSIYITAAEGNTGKSTVALGVVDLLARRVGKVGVFRPITRSMTERDNTLQLMLDRADTEIDYEQCVGVSYDDVHVDPSAALMRIVERYKAIERQCDAVVVVGSDYTDIGRPTELSYNARIAATLGAPVLLVLGGQAMDAGKPSPRSPLALARLAELTLDELRTEHAGLLGIVANRVDPDRCDDVVRAVRGIRLLQGSRDKRVPVWALPEEPFLVAPTVSELMTSVDGELLTGDPERLGREALSVIIAAMSLENVLPRIDEGAVVVVPADRSEVLLALLLANSAGTFPSLSGIVLNGGFELSEPVERLIEGLDSTLPIISTSLGTYDVAGRLARARGRVDAGSRRKEDTALALFEQYVDRDALLEVLDIRTSPVVTPLLFEYAIVERARSRRQHIVLAEGEDDRVLRAASTILSRGIADLTILGEQFEVRSRAIELGVDLSSAEVLSPFDAVLRRRFADEYATVRAGKGASPTLDQASDMVTDAAYFATMMVHAGMADGMVSGAAHTTAHTMRPAYEVLKTREGVDVASGAMLLAVGDRVLVFGDCAVVPEPTAEQLVDITLESVRTAEQFEVEPRVAMLSYTKPDPRFGGMVVEESTRVREAMERVRERLPDVPVEGLLPFDAASRAALASPDRHDAGMDATVFIFPDLEVATTTYQGVERSSAVTLGPIVQGLRKPVNDLSRAATVDDIVTMVAITAVQAAAGGESWRE